MVVEYTYKVALVIAVMERNKRDAYKDREENVYRRKTDKSLASWIKPSSQKSA